MVMLSAEVPESLRRRLNGIAGNQGIAAKDIVTEALEQWLGDYALDKEDPKAHT